MLLRNEAGRRIVASDELGSNKAVAEGVEGPEVLAALGELGCDVAQGYYTGRPMPAADFDCWLQREGLAPRCELAA